MFKNTHTNLLTGKKRKFKKFTGSFGPHLFLRNSSIFNQRTSRASTKWMSTPGRCEPRSCFFLVKIFLPHGLLHLTLHQLGIQMPGSSIGTTLVGWKRNPSEYHGFFGG